MTDNLAIIQAVYAAAGQGDWAAVRAHMADTLVITEAASLPYAGEFRGADALRDLFVLVSGFWDGLVIERRGITAGGDTVIGELFLSGRAKRTGERFAMPVLELWRLEDGKVTEIRPFYFDTARLAAIA